MVIPAVFAETDMTLAWNVVPVTCPFLGSAFRLTITLYRVTGIMCNAPQK